MRVVKEVFHRQTEFFQSGQTKNYAFRKHSLERLRKAIRSKEKKIMEALKKDLNKSKFEAYSTEIGVVLKEIQFVLSNLKKWMKPTKTTTPITHVGSSSYIYPEPYGVTLIIAPWNFPFQLAISPLIGAIAAGNCAVIKPSELAPHTSRVVKEIISQNFGIEYVTVIEGGIETNQKLLEKSFDYIFFTGSPRVGKIVMEAAAKHLTPVTLELGGKSPCIVHKDANIPLAAKRIAWGKFINAGQTCIAPDYIYVHQKVKDDFLSQLTTEIRKIYGKNALQNRNYTRIINERHFDRLTKFISDENVYFGGRVKKEKLLIEPTILTDVSWDDEVMKEEIFGPVLPVMEYEHLTDVYEGIENSPKPLALYLFTESEAVEEEVIETVSFGGGSINDTIYHFANPHLPFGGVGTSGMGAYHGKASFDTFTHYKGVLKQTTSFDLPMRYPNTKNALRIVRMFMR